MTAALRAAVATRLDRPAPPEAAAFAAEWARIGGPTVAAVLFCGGAPDAVLDFHVLVDDLAAWPQPQLAALAAVWLPPNVDYREIELEGRTLRGKAAILQADQFRRLTAPSSLDTSLWTRFAQPAALAWSRDATARDAAVASVARAVSTAALWAARLGPETGPAEAFWAALFDHVRIAGLRIGPQGWTRGVAAPGYDELLALAWSAAGLGFEGEGDDLRPALTRADRLAALDAWYIRKHLGRGLTALRLAKAAFTFPGAADYAAWTIARHTGQAVEVTPWRRRHPLLAAPAVAWRLWRAGMWK